VLFLNQAYAFVDLETTGTNPIWDRITEIAVIHVDQAGEERRWQTLINPEKGIPDQIVALTGINNEMVRQAPAFADISGELHELLQDTVLIAHNARFDYGFLKNAFKQQGLGYRPKIICTVKLSRSLRPEERYHNLAAICTRLGIERKEAHRAMADADALDKLVASLLKSHGSEAVEAAVRKQLAKPSLPVHLEPGILEQIPRSAGVYRFYGEGRSLLYVGKSVNLHSRVLAHFAGDHSNNQDMKLVQSIRDIDWTLTGGDLGAQLLEAREIKDLSPVLNRRQRRHYSLFCYQLKPAADGYIGAVLLDRSQISCHWYEPFYGLYRNKSAAKKALVNVADEFRLCKKRLGLEKGGGACFGYQLKKCSGACVGKESAELFNIRVEAALLKQRVSVWPYDGMVVVREYDEQGGQTYWHLIYHWAYLGTATDEPGLQDLLGAGVKPRFDIDSYRIILRYFKGYPANLLEVALPKSDCIYN
jgi:DNA polymerase-3 subunit epsilon